MLKRLMLFLAVLLVVSSFAYAEEEYTVSGSVYFQDDSDIYINLVSRESFPHRFKPLPPPYSMHIKLTPEQIKAKRVPFKFEGIPKGSYYVLAFQDLNKNEMFDREPSGYPMEPYGTYKTFEFHLQFDKVIFMVDKDITGIKINLESL